jgi:methylthioribose-1-phosphate isomerase
VKIEGVPYRSIFLDEDGWSLRIVDQTVLPHDFRTLRIADLEGMAAAIAGMHVRGAPLLGVAAAYGLALALRSDASDASLERACGILLATRPTAVNLRWALDRVREAVVPLPPGERAGAAFDVAGAIAEEDVERNRRIGEHGLGLVREAAARRPGHPVRILTHCNAGWLATVDWGTATAPIYMAHDQGVPVHVWVDETRPRNQGASLTAWELGRHGVPHTVIVDNAGGHLMQRGQVDLCLVGADRITAAGDVVNKIGTYLKALAANDNGVLFYVAAPSSSVDWTLSDGADVPIEERAGDEVARMTGRAEDGRAVSVRVVPEGSPVANPGFDVTPARLVTALVTERGVTGASREGLARLFPERARGAVSRARPADVRDVRAAVLRAARKMSVRGLSRGTSGNVSARVADGMVVTPSALRYDEMVERDLAVLSLEGRVLDGERKPSSEWPLHAAVYRARPDVGAIVHAHASYCTILAALRHGIPAFHYMVAVAGGDSIRCAPYAPFGSPELAGHVVTALEGRRACLLANHGMVAVGSSPDAALDLAAEVEELAETYWRALQAGEPVLLSADEMAEALERFATYR